MLRNSDGAKQDFFLLAGAFLSEINKMLDSERKLNEMEATWCEKRMSLEGNLLKLYEKNKLCDSRRT